jgi:hypothetical protein
VTVFEYVLYGFFGLGVICLILACTPWTDGTPAEAPACAACSDPSGMAWCVCPVFCGHRLCRGRRVQARWSPGDMDVLDGDLTGIKREGQW